MSSLRRRMTSRAAPSQSGSTRRSWTSARRSYSRRFSPRMSTQGSVAGSEERIDAGPERIEVVGADIDLVVGPADERRQRRQAEADFARIEHLDAGRQVRLQTCDQCSDVGQLSEHGVEQLAFARRAGSETRRRSVMRGVGRLPCEYESATPALRNASSQRRETSRWPIAVASTPRAKRTRTRCAFSEERCGLG